MSSEENNYRIIDTDKYLETIGAGGYGKIFLYEHDGETLARKEVTYDCKNLNNVDDTIREIDLLKEFKHKNVVELKDYYIDTEIKINKTEKK